ncbi:unnamed protein product, partial [Polarella glacialis]
MGALLAVAVLVSPVAPQGESRSEVDAQPWVRFLPAQAVGEEEDWRRLQGAACGSSPSGTSSSSSFAPVPPPLCASCAVPANADMCVYDFSNCGFLAAGGLCEVRCRLPYVGLATTARCPVTNTQVGAEFTWTRPTCSFQECPDPDPVPLGFSRDGYGGFRCSEGYAGQSVRTCSTSSEASGCAVLTSKLFGCLPLKSCRAPQATCGAVDFSSCSEVAAGASCTLSCKLPYVGPSFLASCPRDNTDPTRAPQLPSQMQCQLPCTDPKFLPAGYRFQAGGYVCAEGYVGQAVKICALDTSQGCGETVEFHGCKLLRPCLPLQLPHKNISADPCELDVADCQEVRPGMSCAIKCRLPWDGPWILSQHRARCPASNTDPVRELEIVGLPTCVLACPAPELLPLGYTNESFPGTVVGSSHRRRSVRCADSFVGEVRHTCNRFSDCSFQISLDGCSTAAPCVTPTLDDDLSCKIDLSNCNDTVSPGATCEISCREPYSGTSVIASCPSDNSDPQRPLDFTLPSCSAECDPYPPGYMRTESGWSCAEGFGGSANSSREDCGELLKLTGCHPLVPCANLANYADSCQVSGPDCVGVPSGGTCRVSCPAEIYQEGFSTASCPSDNIDPSTPLTWELTCIPFCEDPDPIPEEYARDEDFNWRCADSFAGNITETCEIFSGEDGNCSRAYNLTGCLPIQPCATPQVNEKIYNPFSCMNLPAGTSCELQCAYPYRGEATVARCPWDNTAEFTQPSFSLPHCNLGCDAVPVGFQKTIEGWRCAPGYAGNISFGCSASWCCGAELALDGCKVIVPCRRPLFTGTDACRFDASSCPESMAPGSSCQVRCNSPYGGSTAIATCPYDNTNVTGQAVWTRPSCILQTCPDPAFPNLNYTKDPGTPDWRCSDFMIGDASKRCESLPSVDPSSPAWPSCKVQEGILTGCGIPADCAPFQAMKVWDECVFDISACGEMVPNSFCQVGCRPPYYGTQTTARCPTYNVDPSALLEWSPPVCVLRCSEPDPVPPGYEKGVDGWRCSEGYIGSPSLTCVYGTKSKCSAVQMLSGCTGLQPCVLPAFAPCSLDLSDCGTSLPNGGACNVICQAGFTGFSVPDPNLTNMTGPTTPVPLDSVLGLCDENNTIVGREMDLEPFNCVFSDCSDPDPIPKGYERLNASDEGDRWQCARGYIGNATERCALIDCRGQLLLEGCERIGTCAPPVVDSCRFDTSSCGSSIEPGGSCPITCRAPTEGKPGIARCAGTFFGTPPVIELPVCSSPCDEDNLVYEPPGGYDRVPCYDGELCELAGEAGPNASSWTCSTGHATASATGNATSRCFVDPENNCAATLLVQGCFPLKKCAGLEYDQCRFVSNCNPGLLPGEGCEVRCRLPDFSGDIAYGTCPPDNTDVLTQPYANMANCKPVCTLTSRQITSFRTAGHNLTNEADISSSSSWLCSTGFTGTPVAQCSVNAQCEPTFGISGCNRIRSCSTPAAPTSPQFINATTNCTFGALSCPQLLDAGATCDVTCLIPYTGAKSTVSCPADNIVQGAPAHFEWPTCTLACPDPNPIPAGYVKQGSGWACNDTGYLGTASTRCYTNENCAMVLELTGCLPLLPCIPPDPRSVDTCRYDTSLCGAQQPGTSCSVSCLPPFSGTTAVSSCPADNIDRYGSLVWNPPECSMVCPDPSPVPNGYAKGQDGLWKCASGYNGTAVHTCFMKKYFSAQNKSNKVCSMEVYITGCVQLQPCVAPLVDLCDFDLSNCTTV